MQWKTNVNGEVKKVVKEQKACYNFVMASRQLS